MPTAAEPPSGASVQRAAAGAAGRAAAGAAPTYVQLETLAYSPAYRSCRACPLACSSPPAWAVMPCCCAWPASWSRPGPGSTGCRPAFERMAAQATRYALAGICGICGSRGICGICGICGSRGTGAALALPGGRLRRRPGALNRRWCRAPACPPPHRPAAWGPAPRCGHGCSPECPASAADAARR
jgi:hypothetical protein